MKKIFFLLSYLFGLTVISFAQQPSFISDSLDSYIQRGIKQWNIPGLAIAIVKDGKVIVMKGYGVSDIKTNTPVDENTLFMIASNSKLFTATSLAQLEYDQQLSLDDKVTKYFPDYRLYDSTTTKLVTIRDLLSHHLGTKTFQGDFTFWDSKLSRRQIMDKMRLLKPSQNFRQSFGYCNSCYLTAGQVIEKVTGSPWEKYVYDSIMQPLGMKNTYPTGNEMNKLPGASKAYTTVYTGQLTELPYDNVTNLAPAASIVSNVKDLSKWLLLQLDSGKYEGRQIIAWPVLQRTREMQTILSSKKSDYFPSHYEGYGMGLFQRDYNGRQVFWHTGGALGFVTNVCFVPEENLGITILTNNDNQDFFETLRYQILDAYLGVKYTDRSNDAWEYFKPAFDNIIQNVKDMKARVKGNNPSLNINAYTGTYQNELFGPITIATNKNDLFINFPNQQNLTATAQYMDNDEWLITYSNIDFGIYPLKFKIENNKVISVDIKVNDELEYDPYTFTKE